MHPIKILDAFNYFPSKTGLLCRFHLCYVILMHLLAILQKERSSGYPCSRCLLGGTGNSHFYCSWPDMLHLLGNPPFLFLTSRLSPTPTHLTPHTLPYSGRCFWAPAPLDFNLSNSSYKSQVTSKLHSKRCDLTCKKYFLESPSVGQFQLTQSFLTGSQFQVEYFAGAAFPRENKNSLKRSPHRRCTTTS